MQHNQHSPSTHTSATNLYTSYKTFSTSDSKEQPQAHRDTQMGAKQCLQSCGSPKTCIQHPKAALLSPPSWAPRRNSARTFVSRCLWGCVGETGLEKEGNKSHITAESCCVHSSDGAMNRAGLLAGTWRCSGVRHRATSGQLALGLLSFPCAREGYAIAGSSHSSWAQNQNYYLYRQALPQTSAFPHLKSQNCKMTFFKGNKEGGQQDKEEWFQTIREI